MELGMIHCLYPAQRRTCLRTGQQSLCTTAVQRYRRTTTYAVVRKLSHVLVYPPKLESIATSLSGPAPSYDEDEAGRLDAIPILTMLKRLFLLPTTAQKYRHRHATQVMPRSGLETSSRRPILV